MPGIANEITSNYNTQNTENTHDDARNHAMIYPTNYIYVNYNAQYTFHSKFIFSHNVSSVARGTFQFKDALLSVLGHPTVEIRRPYARLISTIRFSTLVRRYLYIEMPTKDYNRLGYMSVKILHCFILSMLI